MLRYPGNIRKFPSPVPTQRSSSGIWTMNEQVDAQRRGIWPAEQDPYYNYTMLHIPGNVPYTTGSNPMNKALAYNSDASSNNFNISQVGDVRATRFHPYQNNYSNYFNGSSSYFSLSNNVNLRPGTSDFTTEFWIFRLGNTGGNAGGNATIWGSQWSGASPSGAWMLYMDSSFKLTFMIWNTSIVQSISTFNIGQWYHVAVTRSNTTFKLFVNGNLESVGTSSLDANNSTYSILIGLYNDPPTYNGYFNGYISNLRFVKGTALYTTNFTPSLKPLTVISGTQLLTCQSNRFMDASSNNFTITANGSPTVSPNSPFAEYDITSGSGFFDGSGDYLETGTVSSFNFLHSPSALFTIQCWVYVPSVISSGSITMIGTTPNSSGYGATWTLEYYNSAVYMNLFITRGVGGVWVISGYSTSAFTTYNQWTHLAVTYDQSLANNNAKFYINGQSAGTASKLANAPSSSDASYPLYIGRIPTTTTIDFNGYIADLHISNSVLPITVPTSPLNATTNTKLSTLQTRAPSNNNGFIDSSPNNFLITRNGNTTQGSFSPFCPSGWSNYFDGNGDYIYAGSNSVFDIKSGNFTVELYIYPIANNYSFIVRRQTMSGSYPGWSIRKDGNNYIVWDVGTAQGAFNSIAPITLNNWYHIAVVKSSSTTSLYLNGVFQASHTATALTEDTGSLFIGGTDHNASECFAGYVSSVRLIKGQALYTGNFVAPTAKLTATVVGTTGANVASSITGTLGLLTCQDPYFKDNGNYKFSFSRGGTPYVTPLSPFPPTSTVSPLTTGGSGYFDGTGDYVSVANLFSIPGDFTIECWVYATGTTGGYGNAWGNGNINATIQLYIENSTKTLRVNKANAGDLITGGTVINNTWNHTVVTRSGSTLTLWLNGVSQGTSSTSVTTSWGINEFWVGNLMTGYISGLRVVNYVLYSSTFTPPTTPPTSIPGTSLLLNFTNGAVIDATGKNNIETISNSQISTVRSKYYNGSNTFDGSGDYYQVADNEYLELLSSNFTIEAWIYPTLITGSNRGIFGKGTDGNNWWAFFIESSTTSLAFAIVSGGSVLLDRYGGTTISLNTWQHVAATRNGTVFKLYINGTENTSYLGSPATTSAAVNNFSLPFWIGGPRWSGASHDFNGSIQDLRVTKYLRYSSNFTPPTRTLARV